MSEALNHGMRLAGERAEILNKAAALVRERSAQIVALISAESGLCAYGLSSAVCTNRLDYITRFVAELHVGSVYVREVPGYRLELTPFGGIKDSGLGYKEGVQEAMKSFTNLKTYSLPWS